MAIGFEFATSWNVYKKVTPVFGASTYTKFPKATVLYSRPGWQITVDGSEIEFVLDPVDDARGEPGIVQRFDDFTRGVRMLAVLILRSAAQNKHSIVHVPALNGRPVPVRAINLNSLIGPSLTPASDFYVVCADPHSPITGLNSLPQASVGIRLGRIRKFWRALGQESAANRASTQFGTKASAKTLQSAALNHSLLIDTHWNELGERARGGHRPSAKLRGLITLIATYLMKGQSPSTIQRNSTKVVKNLMLIMSRTSFAALFDQLPLDEQTYYRTNPTHWVNFICRDVMGKVDAKRNYNPDGNLIDLFISDYNALQGDDRVLLPITRKAWLTQMLHHVDLLSADAHPIGMWGENKRLYKDVTGLGHRLRGLAGLGNRMDTIIYKGRPEQAAIFELRAVDAQRIHFRDWSNYAVRVYRFVHAINVGRRHDEVTLEN